MDKTSIFETAGKLTSKGQLDRAAREYRRILEQDPDDVRALQKLAELHQRASRPAEAADLLLQVARIYSGQGFFLKAVAVYKQVLKLGERVEVRLDLAGLYQQLGLAGDAAQQYQTVIAHHEKAGDTEQVLSLLRRLMELDPENVATSVKLGELYAREGQIREAIDELRRAAATLENSGRDRDCLRVLERVTQLAPDDPDVARDLATRLLALGQPKRALARLQICFKADPRHVDTLLMLARAFSELGQDAKTVSVYRELVHLYGERDEVDARREMLRKILVLVPGDPEATRALQEIGAAAPRAAARPAASAPLAAPPADLPPEAARIVTEAEVFVKYGLLAKATDHLRSALPGSPTCIPLHERIIALLERQNRDDEAARARATLEALRARTGTKAPAARPPQAPPADPELLSLSLDDALVEADDHDRAAADAASLLVQEELGAGAIIIDDDRADEEEIVVAVEEDLDHDQGNVVELADRRREEKSILPEDFSGPTPAPQGFPAHPGRQQVNGHSRGENPFDEESIAAFDPFAVLEEVDTGAPTSSIAPPVGQQADELPEELTAMLELETTPPPAAPAPGRPAVNGMRPRLGTEVGDEDAQTHFDLGIAYREMGLLQDATDAFQRVMAVDERRAVDCLLVIGQCSMDLGDVPRALEQFERALRTQGLTLEASKEAHYHIGRCLESLGRGREALGHYARIHKADPKFRDVRARASQLAARQRAEASGGTPSQASRPERASPGPEGGERFGRHGRSKIGYI